MIGYFSLYKSENETYAGGFLILNEKGIPVSFKYTDPVKPTRIQKIIYGNNLKNYFAFEILTNKDLFSPHDVEIIFTDDKDILNYADIEKTIIYLIEVNSDVGFGVKEKEGVIPIDENKSLKFYSTKIVDSTLLKKIRSYAEVFDLLEPFRRLKEALIYICSSEEKE
ncbi:hypothetical protein [Petrotoga sp. 9PWA.NaAc.5.4]|uniref:hypothetical protein n=1 Tax=Petrotoga sp. 9PWA.NaAc.5.4 TaxID=1434328 RepID=UPI000CC6F944|nr:hypothetical protein [Petrotoga sp. 9PWA.NaAc.5.4]PNR97210.1 hypothetical protein X924_00700 [Petrotoga sp. 9PWA.NaAc.5.4]